MKVKLKLPLRQATGYYSPQEGLLKVDVKHPTFRSCVEADGLSTIPPLNAVLKPGDRGTEKLRDQLGDKLLCVRYRYDEATKKQYKTVELIVDEVQWTPPPPTDTNVFLKIRWDEKNIQKGILKAGDKCSNHRKLWKLNYGAVKSLGLTSRIRKG